MVKVNFPGEVWDGTNNVTQRNASARRAPDRHDYDQIAGELIATQTRVLELSQITSVAAAIDTELTNSNSELFVTVDATGGDIDITLPPPATQRFPITVKRVDASENVVTILPNDSEVIDDETSQTLDAQYDALKVIPDGTNWHVV